MKKGDQNHPKVKDVRANLIKAAWDLLGPTSASPDLRRYVEVISALMRAPLYMFTPQLWRIEINAITGRYRPGNPAWDEYSVGDLRPSEFDVIIS